MDTATVDLKLNDLVLGSVTVKLLDADTSGGSGTIQIIKNGSTITNFAITLTNNSTGITKSVNLGDLKFEFNISDTLTTGATSTNIKLQINSINVSLADEKVVNYNYEYEFQDAKEGSFVVEVGQFNGAGTSPLDVRVNYFNDEGLADSLVVDFSDGKAIIGEASIAAPTAASITGGSLSASTSGFSIDLIAKASNQVVANKGMVFTWDTGVYDISDFNGALPKEEVVDSGVVRAEERWYKDTSLIFQIGANEGQNMVAGLDDMRAAALGLTDDSLKVTDQNSAERTIMVIDAAIHKVSSARAKIGAVQNRLEHTISNLGVAAENLTAAESRIRDADMAKEIMEFTKQQILMQSANAMLAQSNMIPQNVLQLLR